MKWQWLGLKWLLHTLFCTSFDCHYCRSLWLRRNFFVLIFFFLFTFSAPAKQTEPDTRRQTEIKRALIEHGYMSGKPADWTWLQTKKVCRDIADEHGWQVNRAPDARVLILLGLGNAHSDPFVAEQRGGHLDQAQRGEQ